MVKSSKEWFKQADYDMNTAEFMFDGGRYFYSVFMLHLSIEKVLKGIYQKKLGEVPPKTHNLIYLINEIKIEIPEQLKKFIIKLNEASVVTRYPEDLDILKKHFDKETVKNLLAQGKETIKWIKTKC